MSLTINAYPVSSGTLPVPDPASAAQRSASNGKIASGSVTIAVTRQSVSPRTSFSLSTLQEGSAGAAESENSQSASGEASGQSAAENALTQLEQMSTSKSSSAMDDAETKLQQLLAMYEKLIVLGDVQAIAALAKQIAAAVKELGEGLAQSGGTAETISANAAPGTSQAAPNIAADSSPITSSTLAGSGPASETLSQTGTAVVAGGTDQEAKTLLEKAKEALSAIAQKIEAAKQRRQGNTAATRDLGALAQNVTEDLAGAIAAS